MDFGGKFTDGLSYEAFLAKYGNDTDRQRWTTFRERISLTDEQQTLLSGFERQMKVLVMAGAWCGDCVNQCPMFAEFAEATTRIELRFVDRDADAALSEALSVCGAPRVPAVVFLSEDDQFVARGGDRTLTKYQQMAVNQLGDRCPPGVAGPPDPAVAEAGILQDWLDEFLRVQLLLRLSPRLREKHGD